METGNWQETRKWGGVWRRDDEGLEKEAAVSTEEKKTQNIWCSK